MISQTPPTHPPEHEPGARAFGETIRAGGCGRCTLRLCAELVGMSMTDLSAVEQGARDSRTTNANGLRL